MKKKKTIKQMQKGLDLSDGMLPRDITTIVKWIKALSIPEGEMLLKRIFGKC